MRRSAIAAIAKVMRIDPPWCLRDDACVDAVDVVKFLGQERRVQALRREPFAQRRRACAPDGPVGKRQDDAARFRLPDDADRRDRQVRGRPIAKLEPEALAKLRRDHIGFVFQSYHLFPTLTAEDNVRLALDVRGERSQRKTAREVLGMVGLGHKTKAFPRELSGGEQQRVAIARAIVGKASAILADEPTGALDAENGQAIMTLLAQIAKDTSRGVLVVTHDPRILPFASRIVHIEDGRIVREEAGTEARRASM